MQVARSSACSAILLYSRRPLILFTNIKHILLTGFYWQQAGLSESIFSQTNTPTEYLHPISYVERSAKLELPQFQIDAPSLTLAFGLALGDFENMIELTRINLLPYREEIKQRKQQQFKILMLGAFAVGLGLAAATYLRY